MTKPRIAAILYRLKQNHESIAQTDGEIYSADELLSMYYGREIEPSVGLMFVQD